MSTPLLSAAQGVGAGGHPIWHFALVSGAGVAVFVGIKAAEQWKDRGRRLPRPRPPIVLLAVLGAASSVIHAMVCPEHFREWVVFGVFFMFASALQAAWSVLILVRPSRTLLAVGALGNVAIVSIFLLSRTYGLPFGPEPFHPEALTALGVAATISELVVVVGASWLFYVGRDRASNRNGLLGRAQSAKGALA